MLWHEAGNELHESGCEDQAASLHDEQGKEPDHWPMVHAKANEV